MRRRVSVAAIAGAALALALVLVVAIGPGADPTRAERADALAAELRCPDCQGLSVADSPTDAAGGIRREIDELLAAGASDAEVRAHFTDRYGEWILLAPTAPLTWIAPFALVAIGLAVVAAWLLVRRPDSAPIPAAGAVTDADRRRLHDEAEALDA